MKRRSDLSGTRKALFAHRQMHNCSCLVTVLDVCGSALVVLIVLQAAAHYTQVDTLWATGRQSDDKVDKLEW
jgi:hypothetical protein